MARLNLPSLPALPELPELPALPSLGADVETSSGLYNLARDSGLQKQADDIMKLHSGEEHKKFLSGGFISDVFDVLNASSYGTVGLLKGKGFAEGIKNRESFADDDALGQYGLTGVIGGTILDIATDPLTYIAPWKVLTKVPGFAKVASATEKFAIGQKELREIGETGMAFETRGDAGFGFKIPDRIFANLSDEQKAQYMNQRFEPLKYVADKFHWMFGADPIFKETFERSQRNKGIEVVNATNIMQDLGKLDKDVSKGLIERDATGRFQRKTLEQIQRELSPEQFAKVAPVWEKIDSLGKELVDLGVLGKGKYEENLGTYLKNAYEQYEVYKNGGKNAFKAGALGVKGTKGRVEGLTEEMMKDLGQIEDPEYLLFKSMLDMIKDVEDAKLFRAVAKNFASDVEVPGFVKLPDSPRLRTSQGKTAELADRVAKVNEEMKPLLKQLKSTFKADKAVLKELEGLEKQITELGTKRAEELTRFFNYGAVGPREVKTSTRLGVVPEKLQPLANKAKQYDSFDDLMASADGIALEKADMYGELDQYGFKNVRQFFDTVKNPYKAGKTKVKGPSEPGTTEAFEASFGLAKKEGDDLVKGKARSAEDAKRAEKKTSTVTMKELDALEKKIRDFNKGFKAGSKATAKQINDAQSAIIKVIKDNFSVKDQAKFLVKIKNTTSPAKLEEMVSKLADEFATIQERQLEELGMPNLQNALKAHKRIQQLAEKSNLLKDIDQKSIANSFINLEQRLSDLRFTKEDLMDEINVNKMGDLAGKYIPANMAQYVNEMVDLKNPFGAKLVSEFKYMKVVLNPATHMRNTLSNLTLNWWKLGIGPWELGRYTQALNSIAKKDEWYKRAQKAGLGASTYASNELKAIFDDPAALKAVRGAGNAYDKVKKFMGDIYQEEESLAKLTAFRYAIEKKGMTDEQAWKFAESGTFNYAQVTPFVRHMRSAIYGVPFITFAVKAAPTIAETAVMAPHRISFFQKLKSSIENLSDDEETAKERETEPDYIKNGFYIKIPGKDEHGRSKYLDMTYFVPLPILMSHGTSKETGLKENAAISALEVSPAFSIMRELAANKDFYGNRIYKETDTQEQQIADISLHIGKLWAPPWLADQLPAGYDDAGERQFRGFRRAATADETNTRRTMYQEILRLGGFKIQPVEADIQDSINDFNKKKALQRLLQDNGVVKEFSRTYIPE